MIKTMKLPSGWRIAKLRELTEYHKQGIYFNKGYSNEGVKLVRIMDMNKDGRLLNDQMPFIKISKNEEEQFRIYKGEFLFARSGSIGTCAIVQEETICVFGSFIIKFKFKENLLDNKYFFYYYKSPYVNKMISAKSHGSTNININAENIKDIDVILPPIQTQKKIVSILEEAEETRNMREESNMLSEVFLRSVFQQMFEHKPFDKDTLKKYCSLISSGSTPLGGSKNYSTSGDILFIRSQNVLMNKFSNHDKLYISREIHENMKRTWVKHNDVLLNITGASIGRTAVYKGPNDKANVNQHVCIIRLKDEKLNPIYLNYYLSTPRFQKHIMMTNAGATRQALNFDQISKFQIPMPPVQLQSKFSKIVEQVEVMREEQEKAKQEVENLFNVIMQKALTGELVA